MLFDACSYDVNLNPVPSVRWWRRLVAWLVRCVERVRR